MTAEKRPFTKEEFEALTGVEIQPWQLDMLNQTVEGPMYLLGAGENRNAHKRWIEENWAEWMRFKNNPNWDGRFGTEPVSRPGNGNSWEDDSDVGSALTPDLQKKLQDHLEPGQSAPAEAEELADNRKGRRAAMKARRRKR